MMDNTGAKSYVSGRIILHKMKKLGEGNKKKGIPPDPYMQAMYEELLDRVGSGFLTEAFARSYEDLALQPQVSLGKKKYSGRMGYEAQIRTLRSLRSMPDHIYGLQRSVYIARGLSSFALKIYRGLQEVGFGVARKAERQYRIAQFGKENMRYIRNIEGKWIDSMLITSKAIDDQILRLTDSSSPAMRSIARNVNNIMGDYTRLSPELRRATMTYAPFALWMRASITWVLTLPAKSPAKVALIASINNMKDEDRALLGLSPLNPIEPGKETGLLGIQEQVTKPSFMLGSIVSGGNLVPTETLSSFGTFYGGLSDITDFLLPQISSSLMIGKGLNWTGEQLVYPDGSTPTTTEKIGIGISNLLETFFPALKWAKAIKAEGAPDETSTVFDLIDGTIGRDTYINQFPGASRYETGKKSLKDTLIGSKGIFNPARGFALEPEDDSSIELGPAPFGKVAEMEGSLERESNLKQEALTEGGWLFGEEKVEELQEAGEIREPPTPVKPKKNWLFN
jgi:hypothetical protein